MATTAGRSRADRMWEAAAAELAAQGLIPDRAVTELSQAHQRMLIAEQRRSRRSALIELAGYSGAALAVVGTAAISSQVWQDVGSAAQVFVLGLLGSALLTAGAMIVRSTPADGAALRTAEQAPRRRLVGVLGIGGAGLLTASVAVGIDAGLSAPDRDRWMWLAAATGLAIAVAVRGPAPGVVPTLAVGAYLPATVLLLLNGLGWLEPVWAGPLAVLLIAVAAALVLVRLLTPPILVEAVAIVAWLATAASMVGMGRDSGLPDGEATAALWLGRVGLAALIAAGALIFARGGSWPWAVGVAGGSAALIGLTFAEALGGAVAMTIAGVVLIVMSVLLLRAQRRDPA